MDSAGDIEMLGQRAVHMQIRVEIAGDDLADYRLRILGGDRQIDRHLRLQRADAAGDGKRSRGRGSRSET